MDNEKMFELLEKFYGEFSQFRTETVEGISGLNNRMDGLEDGMVGMGKRMGSIENNVRSLRDITTKIELAIETEIHPKIQALLDGHVNHSEQLERIEKEVTRQDEIIMRRIK